MTRPVVGIIGNQHLINETYPAHAGGVMNTEAVSCVSGCLPLLVAADPRFVSVEELMAMAAEARQNAQLHDCCDWGGLGCVPETVRGGATMQMSQIVTMQSTNSSASKSEGD